MDWKSLFERVSNGSLSVAEALALIETRREVDLGFARVDVERAHRCGLPEAIYGAGKTPDQVVGIVEAMRAAGQNVLATRVTPEQVAAVRARHPDVVYHEAARAFTLDGQPLPEPAGLVIIVSAGTSDLAVAEEAGLVARRMGARVEQIHDVGVAGLHRLMKHLDRLRAARVVVVVAGMEGALPSVVGGLIDRPIIAVPTSVGYGMNLNGLAALLAMLNSCAPGITVVNVDNGFGAGVAAARINRTESA
jgi:NCAIR mutase (PurE)-related protein